MRSTPWKLRSAAPVRAHRHSSVTLALTAVLLASVASASPASAQGGMLGALKKRASDAVEQKANQKVNQKIDQAAQKLVDRSFDSMFGGREGGGGNGSGGGSGGSKRGGFSLFPNAPTEAAYDFDASLVYEIVNTSKGKSSDDAVLVTMLFNRDGKYTGAKFSGENRKKSEGDLFAIFDIKNESMVMLIQSDKEKMSMAYSWKDAQKYASTAPAPTVTKGSGSSTTVTAPNAKPVTYSSLGTRTIAGYRAEGYKASGEDGDAEVWVTREAGLPSGRLMGPASSMRQMRGVTSGAYPTGLLLEVITTDHTNGDTGRMTIKSIDTKSRTRIDMSEFPRMGASK